MSILEDFLNSTSCTLKHQHRKLKELFNTWNQEQKNKTKKQQQKKTKEEKKIQAKLSRLLSTLERIANNPQKNLKKTDKSVTPVQSILNLLKEIKELYNPSSTHVHNEFVYIIYLTTLVTERLHIRAHLYRLLQTIETLPEKITSEEHISAVTTLENIKTTICKIDSNDNIYTLPMLTHDLHEQFLSLKDLQCDQLNKILQPLYASIVYLADKIYERWFSVFTHISTTSIQEKSNERETVTVVNIGEHGRKIIYNFFQDIRHRRLFIEALDGFCKSHTHYHNLRNLIDKHFFITNTEILRLYASKVKEAGGGRSGRGDLAITFCNSLSEFKSDSESSHVASSENPNKNNPNNTLKPLAASHTDLSSSNFSESKKFSSRLTQSNNNLSYLSPTANPIFKILKPLFKRYHDINSLTIPQLQIKRILKKEPSPLVVKPRESTSPPKIQEYPSPRAQNKKSRITKMRDTIFNSVRNKSNCQSSSPQMNKGIIKSTSACEVKPIQQRIKDLSKSTTNDDLRPHTTRASTQSTCVDTRDQTTKRDYSHTRPSFNANRFDNSTNMQTEEEEGYIPEYIEEKDNKTALRTLSRDSLEELLSNFRIYAIHAYKIAQKIKMDYNNLNTPECLEAISDLSNNTTISYKEIYEKFLSEYNEFCSNFEKKSTQALLHIIEASSPFTFPFNPTSLEHLKQLPPLQFGLTKKIKTSMQLLETYPPTLPLECSS